jgi:ribonuclease HI
MPSFQCVTCGADFEIPAKALEKYPGWTPKFCREHSPAKGKKKTRKAGGRRRGGSSREEDLTLAQVLEKYEDGPQDGVFTDGSSHPNPGPGGWGMVWVEGGEVREQLHGEDPDTTNNRMELKALIEAFKLLPEDADVTVHTDSRLCVDTITKWAPGWERKGWKKKGGPIKNLELVKELLALARAHPRAKLEWIEAHSGNRWNEYADSLASAWRRDEL